MIGIKISRRIAIALLLFPASLFSALAGRGQSPPDPIAEAAKLYGRASEQIDRGEFRPALATLERALKIVRSRGNRGFEGDIINDIGIIYRNLGESDRALEFAEQALKIYQEIGDLSSVAQSYNNLASVHQSLSQYPESLSYFQQALATVRELGEAESEAFIQNNLGAVYRSLGRPRKALEHFETSWQLFRDLNLSYYAGILLNNIGSAYLSLKEYESAKIAFEKSLEIAREEQDNLGVAQTSVNLGGVYERLSDYQKALQLYESGLAIASEIGESSLVGQALNNIGSIYRLQNQPDRAIAFYQKALNIRQTIGDRAGEAVTLNNIGAIQFEQKQLETATKNLYSSIEILESLRPGLSDYNKIALFDNMANTYGILQQVLVAQNQIETALEISERGRSRALIELLYQSKNRTEIDKITVDFPTIEDIKMVAVRQKSTLVEYSIAIDNFGQNSQLLIWVVDPEGAIAFRSVNLNEWGKGQEDLIPFLTAEIIESSPIAELVRGFRAPIESGTSAVESRKVSDRKLAQLHQLLIEPIADLLSKDPESKVIFIPHKELLLVPFAALIDGENQYLIEKHAIATSPAIQLLQLAPTRQNRISPKTEILAIGNPAMPDVAIVPGEQPEPLRDLPASEQEAIAIAQMFDTRAFIGKNATETAIVPKLPEARMIHFATHGLLQDFTGSGLPGAIALSPSETDDGLLTADEILRLNLNAELVVLSACNTGVGTVTGDGIVGLSRSLMAAGVPSLIVSLWAVEDLSTSELMQEFYRQLRQNYETAKALKNAMLKTRENHPHPKSWAGFILVGNPG